MPVLRRARYRVRGEDLGSRGPWKTGRSLALHHQDGTERPVHHGLGHVREPPGAAGGLRPDHDEVGVLLGGHSGDRLRGVRECWMRLDADGLFAAISCSLASNDPVGPAAEPEGCCSSATPDRRARRRPSVVTMWSVPPDARTMAMAPRTARVPPAESVTPTTTFSNTDQPVPVRCHRGAACPRSERDHPGHRSMGRSPHACGTRRSDQDWHVRRFGQLLADASGEALMRHTSRVEPQDDEVRPERLGRLGDAADQSLVAHAPGCAADREVIGQLPSPRLTSVIISHRRRDVSWVS